jgi:hypothetical protein
MKYYKGNEPGQTPGLIPGDYNWWEAGAMFGEVGSHYGPIFVAVLTKCTRW